MVSYGAAWLSVVISFLAIDAVWLAIIARDFYRRRLGDLMREEVWFGVAGLFYLFYAIAIVILVVVPAHRAGSLQHAIMLGAVLGLCAYGTYDVTNLATLRGWPVSVAVVDVIWGAILTSTVSAIGYATLTWIRPA